MDRRSLEALELAAVARLYGLVEADVAMPETAAAPSAARGPTPAASRPAPAARPPAEAARLSQADWCFVAPGEGEGIEGRLEGPADKLLDAMLAAIGAARGKGAWVATAPAGDEIAAFDRALAEVRPKVMVALGQGAAARLLGTDASLETLRGTLHRYRDIPVVVTCHPAHLLQSPLDKARAWEDLVLARRALA